MTRNASHHAGGRPAAVVLLTAVTLAGLVAVLGTALADTYDVYAQKAYTTADNAGATAWQADGTPLCTASLNQWYPTVIDALFGYAISVWHDGRIGTNGLFDIYAQRMANADGGAVWGQDGAVVTNAAGDQTFPVGVEDGQGGVIIAWWDTRNGEHGIYAQHLDADGQRRWAQDVLICYHAGSEVGLPVIASDLDGGAIIAWEDDRNLGTTSTDIYAQRVNGAGVGQWGINGREVCRAAGIQQEIAIVSDQFTGGAILAWTDKRDLATTGNDVYAQRVHGNGAVQWAANGVAACNSNGHQLRPALEIDQVGGAIVAWEDGRGAVTSIYAQRLNLAGQSQWAAQGKRVTNAQSHAPTLVTDWFAGAIVAWQDYRSASPDPDIYAQRLHSDGSLWGADVAVCAAGGGQFYPRIETDCAGGSGAIIAWQDERNGIANDDIYAQRVDGNGQVVWAANGIAVCTANADQERPELAHSSCGAAVIVWMDKRQDPLGAPLPIDNTVDLDALDNHGVVTTRAGINPPSAMGVSLNPPPALPRVFFPSEHYVDPAAPNAPRAWLTAGTHLATRYGPGNAFLTGGNPAILVPDRIGQPCSLRVRLPVAERLNGDADLNVVRLTPGPPGNAVTIPIGERVETIVLLAGADGQAPDPAALEVRFQYEGGGTDIRVLSDIHLLGRLAPLEGSITFGNEVFATNPVFMHTGGVATYASETWQWYACYPDPAQVVSTIQLVHPNPGDWRSIYVMAVSYSTPVTAGLADELEAPASQTRLVLYPNHPNPFNPSTSIRFALPAAARVGIQVLAPSGRLVASLLEADLPAGSHAVAWDGRDARGAGAPSGVYYYRVTSGGATAAGKMTLLK